MKKLAILPLSLGCVFAVSNANAIDLKQSKVTQVVNDVQIISAANQEQKNASVNDVFSMPDILRTGMASRAELVAADETVTRVGANTIFSFDPASRTIDLKQGSLLFHSPHGKGGGTIHTGSATASVLGTTLIVTTTPSGGMKVLDLEGNVEVKFLNGLKQNLDPGHMTFVMPGGKQLSPIIVFRLDSLTKQSLLVNGFNQNLASMPLIQQQIDKQLKLLQSGKLTDTGLQVAGDANSQGIPATLDLNTLQSALDQSFVNSASVNAAFTYDAYINSSTLPNKSPKRIFLTAPDAPFLITGNTFYTGRPFEGFIGKNIFFNTIHANPLPVDLSAYAGVPEFDFVAGNNLTLAGSVNFNGLSASQSIIFSLVAGNQILVAAGSTINGNIANFNWQTPNDLTLDGVQINNTVGNTSFGLGGNFTMQNGAYIQTEGNLSVRTAGNIAVNHSTLGGDSLFLTSAHGTLGLDTSTIAVNSFGVLTANNTLTVNNSALYANAGSGLIGLNSTAGSVNVSSTSFQALSLSMDAGDSISLDGAGQTFNVVNGNFLAPNLISINNMNFNNFSSLSIAANTVTIMNTTFNPNIANNVGTQTGTPNIDNGVHTGGFNMINDKLGNTAITSISQINLTSGPSTLHGVNSFANASH